VEVISRGTAHEPESLKRLLNVRNGNQFSGYYLDLSGWSSIISFSSSLYFISLSGAGTREAIPGKGLLQESKRMRELSPLLLIYPLKIKRKLNTFPAMHKLTSICKENIRCIDFLLTPSRIVRFVGLRINIRCFFFS
jgi:hypothetical protein